MFGLKSNISDLHELNETLFNHIFDIVQHSDVHDDDVHRYHYVFDFDATRILKDLHAIVDKINKTLEFLMVLTIKQSNLYVSNYFTLTIITDI